jgi:hypothetical protein
MSGMNPLWGAPRIHGELLKLGVDVCEATVAKYMARRQRPPTQTWRTDPRPIAPPTLGPIIAIPQVGGLHYRYDRRAA